MADTQKQEIKAKTRAMLELVGLKEAALDEETRKARVTLITPGWSSNGRYYSKEVIAASAGLWEGAKAYRDHPTRSELASRPERSISDLVGVYENVSVEGDGRLTADLLVEDESTWSKLKFAATKRSDYLGLSINAIGSIKSGRIDGKAGDIVESIVKANSTDIVTVPAAGGRVESLYMSGGGIADDLIEVMPLDELKETLNAVRQDLVEAWRKEWKATRDTEALKSARDEVATHKQALSEAENEVAQLKAKNTTLQSKLAEAEKNAASVKRLAMLESVLASAKLPTEWATALKEELAGLEESKWMDVIQREMAKARSVPTKVAVTGAPAQTQTNIRPAKLSPVNPIAESLGVDPAMASVTNYRDYLNMKKGK